MPSTGGWLKALADSVWDGLFAVRPHSFPFSGRPKLFIWVFLGSSEKRTHKTADEPAVWHDMAMKMQATGPRFVDGRYAKFYA